MSLTPRTIRNLAIGSGCVFVVLLYAAPVNIFRTKGVKRVEDRWSSAGGAKTHTPAVATKLGTPDDTPKHINPKGVDTEYFKENQSSQKKDSEGVWPDKFYEAHYNNPKGK